MIMLLLDIYKWCESWDGFGRQHLAKYVYQHKELERIAKQAGLSSREMASAISKEFIARHMTEGYLNGNNLWYSAKGLMKRPFGFDFKCYKEGDEYTSGMARIREMSDEELFR